MRSAPGGQRAGQRAAKIEGLGKPAEEIVLEIIVQAGRDIVSAARTGRTHRQGRLADIEVLVEAPDLSGPLKVDPLAEIAGLVLPAVPADLARFAVVQGVDLLVPDAQEFL